MRGKVGGARKCHGVGKRERMKRDYFSLGICGTGKWHRE